MVSLFSFTGLIPIFSELQESVQRYELLTSVTFHITSLTNYIYILKKNHCPITAAIISPERKS